MKLPRGLEILEDREGSGRAAQSGDRLTYNVRIFLNKGDEVPINAGLAERGVPEDRIRRDGGQLLIDHISTLGKREVIAGIEKALFGMRAGGFRKLRVGPHLAYRDRGLPGLIPPDAVLNVSVWLRAVVAATGRGEPDR